MRLLPVLSSFKAIRAVFLSWLFVIGFPLVAGAEEAKPTAAHAVLSSMKDIRTICIGLVQGDPIDTGEFKELLQKQLQLVGFQVTAFPDACEAELWGTLHTVPINYAASGFGNSSQTAAYIQMVLVAKDSTILWKKRFSPLDSVPLGLYPIYMLARSKRYVRGKGYIRGNGMYNRALDVSESLSKAKKKAIND